MTDIAPLPTPTATPTPLTIILRSSIEGTSDFFPFQDIATLNDRSSKDDFSFKGLLESGINGGQEIVLFESGCRVDGVSDCTRACNDTTLFFGSLETFYNCASLSSIAYWTQDAKSYYVSDEGEKNVSSIMGGGTVSEFDGRPVLNSFISCAKDSCDNDNLATPCDHSIDQLSINNSSAEDVFDAMDAFCPDITAEINPDIFGPGVRPRGTLNVKKIDPSTRCSSHTCSKSAFPAHSICSPRASLSGYDSLKAPGLVLQKRSHFSAE